MLAFRPQVQALTKFKITASLNSHSLLVEFIQISSVLVGSLHIQGYVKQQTQAFICTIQVCLVVIGIIICKKMFPKDGRFMIILLYLKYFKKYYAWRTAFWQRKSSFPFAFFFPNMFYLLRTISHCLTTGKWTTVAGHLPRWSWLFGLDLTAATC